MRALAFIRNGSAAALVLAAACSSSSTYNPRCPSSVPRNGTPCDIDAGPLECEYGGDSLGRGTQLATCAADQYTPFTWYISDLSRKPNPASCPGAFAAAQGASCPSSGPIACDYDEGRCACVCEGTTTSWKCRVRSDVPFDSHGIAPPDAGPPCPAARPLAGTRCGETYLFCEYCDICGDAALSFGPCMTCGRDGYWVTAADPAAACAPYSCPGF